MTRLKSALCILAAAAVLVGCAAEQSYKRGETLLEADHPEEALAEYQKALAAEPTNAKFRIGYLNARDKSERRFLEAGDTARLGGRLDEARALYDRALRIDENSARAKAGLQEIDRAERHGRLVAAAEDDARAGNVDRALATLRAVLSENPHQPAALALRAKLRETQNRPRVGMEEKLAQAFRKPVSLEFRDAQLKQVLEVLSRSSGLNFVLDKDVRGDQRTSIFLRNSTVADALSMILLTNQLEQRVLDANSVLIFPNNPAKLRDYQPLSVRSFVLSSADAKTVANSLKTILKTKDMVVDEKQNMILLRDTPEAIQMAERIVALHDQPEAEVMLDVEVLEVKRSRLQQLGVQYPTQVALAPMTSASGAQLTVSDLRHLKASTIGATVGSVAIQATETVGDINVLANPRIRTRNREKAKVQVGQRVPNITSTSTATGFVSETVQYVDVGLKLEVEPDISPDGEVAMKVNLEVSNILNQIQTKAGSIAYEIGTRNATTVLRLRDGENQVLAGLINDEDRRSVNRLPGLGSVPVLGGSLFGGTQTSGEKSEIVLSITPHIVRTAYRPDLSVSEFESGTEASLRSRLLDGGRSSAARVDTNPPASSPINTAPPSAPKPADVASAAANAAPEADTHAPAATPTSTTASDAKGDPASAPSSPPATGTSGLSWRAPAAVRVGQQFGVDVWATTDQALAIIPITVTYDSRAFSVVSVTDGTLMSTSGVASTLSKRVDAAAGSVKAVVTAAGNPTAIAQGSLLHIVFKAVSPAAAAALGVHEAVKAVSASGESVMLATPDDWHVAVQ